VPDALIARSIFDRFVRIGSAMVLARELRAEGVRTKRGKLVDKGDL
jgi:site-specific DNA recombinase